MSAEENGAGAELAPAPRALDPVTGQVLELRDMSARDLGEFLVAARAHEELVKESKRAVSAEVHRRMDAAAEWTLREGGFELKGQSPDRVDVDVDVLRAELAGLVKNGLISKEARDRAIKRETSYKPVRAGINALKKLGGEVAAAIERAESASTRPRAVHVKPPAPEPLPKA